MNVQVSTTAVDLGNILLTAGSALIKAGAGSSRVVLNLRRIASAYGFEANVDLTTRNISISLFTENSPNAFSGNKSLPELPGVNFKVIDAISDLSWAVSDGGMSLEELKGKLRDAMGLSHYPRYILLLLTSLAGAAFCFTFGGNSVEMFFAFLATFAGLFLKQEMIKKKFNTYLVTYSSSVLAALVVGIAWISGVESKLDHAFATSILFLIPGVPLINSVIDLMDGYIINGIDRGVNALIHAFAIASGLATIILIFKVQ